MRALVFSFILIASVAGAQENAVPETEGGPSSSAVVVATSSAPSSPTLADYCVKALKSYEGGDEKKLRAACEKAVVLDDCKSVKGDPIFHYDRPGVAKDGGVPMKILVFSLIHGDETHAGTVGRFWMERLDAIDPLNSWRVVPVLNPDGVQLKTRTNANRVDLNRNFPTKDWEEKAVDSWEKTTHRNVRRFPGKEAASEPETRCAVRQIKEFQPDFVVSIHTPLKVLDFDGPKLSPPPKFDLLPWKSLGHFPGSLGRYLWHERSTPLLTMELAEKAPKSLKPFEQLQDIIGKLAAYEERAKTAAK